jgi:succinate dehydrogenase / fumarate reductase cytochrome b subunit
MAEVKSSLAQAARRPLSPHLHIYKPMLTMVMSIAHRITGVALYVGTLLLAWFLIAAASDAASFALVASVLNSWFGILVLVGFSWALFHHFMGGIRHAIWDAGIGFEHPARERLAQLTIIGSVALTVVTWAIVLWMK